MYYDLAHVDSSIMIILESKQCSYHFIFPSGFTEYMFKPFPLRSTTVRAVRARRSARPQHAVQHYDTQFAMRLLYCIVTA